VSAFLFTPRARSSRRVVALEDVGLKLCELRVVRLLQRERGVAMPGETGHPLPPRSMLRSHAPGAAINLSQG
jgi:hypothetical protein